MYPDYWLNPSYSIQFNQFHKLWCSINSNCSKLNITLNELKIYPYDLVSSFVIPLNIDFPSTCLFLLSENQLKLQLFVFEKNIEILQQATLKSDSYFEINRTSLSTNFSYRLTFIWMHSSIENETISKEIPIENLPYISIVNAKFDFYYQYQNLQVHIDHDLRRFDESEIWIGPDSFNGTIQQISDDGKYFNFTTILDPLLAGVSKLLIIRNSNHASNVLTNPNFQIATKIQVTPNFILTNQSKTLQLTGILQDFYGIKNYSLVSHEYGCIYNCSFVNEKLFCLNTTIGFFNENIFSIPFNVMLGDQNIDDIQILYYEINSISNVYPNQSSSVSDVFVAFDSSTFRNSISNIQIQCVSGNYVFSTQFINDTMIKCLDVVFNETSVYEIDISIKNFTGLKINQHSFKYFYFRAEKIAPSRSLILVNKIESFKFSTESPMSSNLLALECRLENGNIFQAINTSNSLDEFSCDIELNYDHNITLW
eukprot:gene13136-8870_t